VKTQADFYRKVWSRCNAGCDIPLKLLQDVDIKDVSVHSIDRGDYYRASATY
jgi:hypothetical protein